MNRRQFCKRTGMTALSVAAGGSIRLRRKKPNVLFIAIDDLNDWTGFLGGHPQALTPNMDRLAGSGMVFHHHQTNCPECSPSRAAMLSGYHPKTTGFGNNFGGESPREWRVSRKNNRDYFHAGYATPDLSEAVLLPQWFKQNGYYCAGTGKVFHSTHERGVDLPNSWHAWADPTFGDDTRLNRPVNPLYRPPVQWLDWGPLDVPETELEDYRRAAWMADQLHQVDRAQPFFLAVGFKKPHDPFLAPRKFFNRFPPVEDIVPPPIYDNGPDDNDWNDLPHKGRILADKGDPALGFEKNDYEIIRDSGPTRVREVARAYLATINYVDECVGLVLDALAAQSFANDTIVILWSDHGWHLGEKLHYHKFTLWREAVRSPFIVKVPGMKSGECKRLVNTVDIFPTLVELCGDGSGAYLKSAFDKQGHSLVPLLKDPDRDWCIPSLATLYKRFPPLLYRPRQRGFYRSVENDRFKKTHAAYSEEFMAHGLTTEKWKLIQYREDPVRPGEDPKTCELYDLEADPREHHNLADRSEYADVKCKLYALIHKFPGGEDGVLGTNPGPAVILGAPLKGMKFKAGDEIRIMADAYHVESPDAIRGVTLFCDGRQRRFDKPSCQWTVRIDAPGFHEIQAVAVDQNGREDVFAVTVEVEE